MVDSVIHDGLWCACENWHMGMTGEAVAEKYGVSRVDQDAYAVASHQKAVAARAAGAFADEILPVTHRREEGPADDRRSRRGGARGHHAGDARRAQAGVHADGTVTAGNAPGLNDGAAAVVVMSDADAARARPDAARPHRRAGDQRPRSRSG